MHALFNDAHYALDMLGVPDDQSTNKNIYKVPCPDNASCVFQQFFGYAIILSHAR
jgi:hypothetical protein